KTLAAIRLVSRKPRRHLHRAPFKLCQSCGRLGIGVESPLPLLELTGPVDEVIGVILVSDLRLFKLARGEPFMFLAQFDGNLGDRLLVFDWQLTTVYESSQLRGGRLLGRGKLAQGYFVVIGGRGLVGD